MLRDPHLLIIGSVWPEPASSAAGSRMLQLIRLFKEQDWKVTFASAAADSSFSVNLEETGVEKTTILLNDESFDVFIRDLNPSAVMFDRFMTEEQFGWRVAEQCPDALRILDTEDLHCLRQARQSAWKEGRVFSTGDLFSDVAKREIASIYRCDLSLIISEYEMTLLKDVFRTDPSLLHYLPFLPGKADLKGLPSFDQRNGFIAIGNFLHEPNWNSVLYLKEEIWPLIRNKLPEAELRVYGAYPSQKVNALHNAKEGFLVMGRASDAAAVVQNARVLLAPLRYGAGLKGKLIDAMLCGTPNITTTIGAEAMHGEMEWGGIVADSTREFAAAAVRMYTDEALWLRSQQNGARIINTRFQKDAFSTSFIEKIIFLSDHLSAHRKNNFTGAMLLYHTISGTKYMSRWIEEKNKK